MFTVCQLLAPNEGAAQLVNPLGDAEAHVADPLGDAEVQLVHSKICFETVMRLYYLRNGYEGGNMILLHFLAVLSFMALGEEIGISTPGAIGSAYWQEDTRSTLILTAKGLHEQGMNYFLGATISHVLRNQMAANDAAILDRHCTTSEDPVLNEARAMHVKAQYPLNIAKMTNDPETQRLENIIKQYESLAVEQTGSGTNEG